MPTTFDINTIAHQIKTAQDQGLPMPQITSLHAAFDTTAAYAVADLIHNMRLADGAHAVGRKIGFTNPAMWAQYGVAAPIWGYMYNNTVEYLADFQGTQSTPTCSLRGFINPKIEPEIIFHFWQAPPADGDIADVLACIDWVAHGFEVVQSPFADWKFQAADAIAVGGLHARLLVGKPQMVQTLGANLREALASFTLALSSDGKLLETGQGNHVLGNPLAAVRHLMQAINKQSPDQSLQANELVTTGTVTSAYSVQPGQNWQTALLGIYLAGLSVAFVD